MLLDDGLLVRGLLVLLGRLFGDLINIAVLFHPLCTQWGTHELYPGCQYPLHSTLCMSGLGMSCLPHMSCNMVKTS